MWTCLRHLVQQAIHSFADVQRYAVERRYTICIGLREIGDCQLHKFYPVELACILVDADIIEERPNRQALNVDVFDIQHRLATFLLKKVSR